MIILSQCYKTILNSIKPHYSTLNLVGGLEQEKLRLREAAPELTAAELLASEAERLEEDDH